MSTTWSGRAAVAVLVVVAAWEFSYRLGAVPLLDDPNEAEYAEVAREMLETGDWISPRLNYVLFLNKPPLAYWMIGLANLAFGVNEFAARLPSACAGLAVFVMLVALGTQLYTASTGLLAGAVLMTMSGFFIETHEVRPDLWLTAGIVGSAAALARLLLPGRLPQVTKEGVCGAPAVRWPLIGWQVSLAVAVLAKGLLGLLLPGLLCTGMIVIERRFDLIPRLLHPRAWWIFVLLIVPWHAVMTVSHAGFVWDYVVHQHLLFFFDRKLPRDSVPVSLVTFWAALALRLFPWTLFAPLAVLAAVRRARGGAAACGDRLTLTWAAMVLLFFSMASSRMEHYSIPALPALALLTARLFDQYIREPSPVLSHTITGHVVALAALALTGPFLLPRIVAAQEWLAPAHDLPNVARWVFTVLALGLLAAAAAALGKRRAWVPVTIAATFVAAVPLVIQGMQLFARVNSSAGMAAALRAYAQPGEQVVYEAPVEYQNCAGFNFYLRRRVDLLRPAGFVPPRYLEPYVDELFISPERLASMWEQARTFLVTNPLQPRARLDGTVPHPFYVVARDTVRWALTSRPVH